MPAAAAAAPKYSVLIAQAITALKERSGSSLPAIVKCFFARCTRLHLHDILGQVHRRKQQAHRQLQAGHFVFLPSPLASDSNICSSSLLPSKKVSPKGRSSK
jgi:hypothetical protein